MNGATTAAISPTDERVDVSAKFSLQRMLQRSDMRADAARLIDGIDSGQLAGIFGDDVQGAVRLAQQHRTARWLLVPKGEDAALVLDPAAPMSAPPTIIFRRPTSTNAPGVPLPQSNLVTVRARNAFGVADPLTGQMVLTRNLPVERIDRALQKASQTFEAWLSGQLASCDGGGVAVPNVVPQLCLAPSRPAEFEMNAERSGLVRQMPVVAAGGSKSGGVGVASSNWMNSVTRGGGLESVNLFLTIKASGGKSEPILGDSLIVSGGRKDSIECLYYEQGVASPRDVTSGAATGKRQYKPIIIGKRVDRSTPLLAKALTENQILEAIIKFYRANQKDGTSEQFYSVELKQVRIASLKHVTGPAAVPGPLLEEIALVFNSISWTWAHPQVQQEDQWNTLG
jgi:type VI secretion system secreted protein Hcp